MIVRTASQSVTYLTVSIVLVAMCVLVMAGPQASDGPDRNPFVAAAFDRVKIEAAIEAEHLDDLPVGVTGIVVPHHLVAADLVARGFRAASGGDYDRIIVLAPDHFRAASGRFATTLSGFDTIFGKVDVDAEAIGQLTGNDDLVTRLGGLSHEHGIVSMMPFIRHFFPDVPVLPVIAAIDTTPEQWNVMTDRLRPLITARTLIVQSTDFSHYLPVHEAVLRDQESLAGLATGEAAHVNALLQPDHLDTKAMHTIMMALQRPLSGGVPVVIANRNSADYSGITDNTTSYIAAVYLRDPAEGRKLIYDDQSVAYFGGDVLLGRYFTPELLDAKSRDAIIDVINGATGGAPLIVNLEGVILDAPVAGLRDDAHLMLRDIALPMLKDMGVTAASLANNHSRDLGDIGHDETLRHLGDAGIMPLIHSEMVDLGSARVVALNMIAGRGDDKRSVMTRVEKGAAVCGMTAAPPLIAFMHWGTEYTSDAGDLERAMANQLAQCGVGLILGAHSHQASPRIEALPGHATNMIFSLGNLVFDQRGARATSALAEVRVFASGTVAIRLVPLPNLFDLASGQAIPIAGN